MTTKTHLRLWQPPGETLEAIGSVLRTHWAAAKSLQPGGQFWARPANWLCQQATRLDHQLTSGGKLIRYASGSASVLNPNFVPRS